VNGYYFGITDLNAPIVDICSKGRVVRVYSRVAVVDTLTTLIPNLATGLHICPSVGAMNSLAAKIRISERHAVHTGCRILIPKVAKSRSSSTRSASLESQHHSVLLDYFSGIRYQRITTESMVCQKPNDSTGLMPTAGKPI
jgi:hypothetical protein